MASASCLARTGLVGHPSDGYGGATLAVALHNFAAHVDAEPAAALDIAPACEGQWPEGGRSLIAAVIARFAREHPGFDPRVAIRYRSTIPRQLGLGGSSALVIATLRALAELAGTTIPETKLPRLALAVETEELGIAAGLQDRVVQTSGGLVFMDFATHDYEPLPCELLPALFVAWRPEAAGSSGGAHAGVRERFQQGDRTITAAMATLGQLARDARAALEANDHDAFGAALDAGYDVRARIFDLDPRHTELIDAARALGLHATYTGSGGAIAGIASGAGADGLTQLAERLRPLGAYVAHADVAPR